MTEVLVDPTIELQKLCMKLPSLAADFIAAFKERGSLPELEESRGLAYAAPIIAGLFRTNPTESHVGNIKSRLQLQPKTSHEPRPTDLNDLLTAARAAKEKYPKAIHRLASNASRRGISIEQMIGAQMLGYVENKEAYPL